MGTTGAVSNNFVVVSNNLTFRLAIYNKKGALSHILLKLTAPNVASSQRMFINYQEHRTHERPIRSSIN